MAYVGTKMSERAHEAHLHGEAPWSEWTKDELISYLNDDVQELARKLTLKELREELLTWSSWHHTGNCYNRTDFYEIDMDAAENVTTELINNLIAARPKRERKPKEQALFVTAQIEFTEWVGQYRNYKRPVKRVCNVKFMSNEKQVKTEFGVKRLSSVHILKKIEQKTKFADFAKLK